MSDIKKNKLKNEEYKIWKKSIPLLYNHISSFKPKFDTRFDDILKFDKRFTFTNKIIPDKEKGLLSTSALYSQGSDIYEIDCALPLGAFYKSSEESGKEQLPDPDYGDAFRQVEKTSLKSTWNFPGENIIKMDYTGGPQRDSCLLAMSSNGSLAWFKKDVKVPVHIMQEIMGPGTSFSSIHSSRNSNSLTISDFALSDDLETLVKCQSTVGEEESILKIADNSGKPGEVLRKINVPATVTHSVRFFDNHLFATCSDDNVIRFWDTRTNDKALWTLQDPKHGKILSFDVSKVLDTLFATGSDTGIVKVWDVRAVAAATEDFTNRQNGQDPIQKELISLYHSGGDDVVDLQFSPTSSSEFLTVGGSGNIYHWDMEYFFSEFDDDNADVDDLDLATVEALQKQCLRFLHTGGSRRSIGAKGKRNTVAWHPVIDSLVGTVDTDSLITVYKPFSGREQDDDNDEIEGKDEAQEKDAETAKGAD